MGTVEASKQRFPSDDNNPDMWNLQFRGQLCAWIWFIAHFPFPLSKSHSQMKILFSKSVQRNHKIHLFLCLCVFLSLIDFAVTQSECWALCFNWLAATSVWLIKTPQPHHSYLDGTGQERKVCCSFFSEQSERKWKNTVITHPTLTMENRMACGMHLLMRMGGTAPKCEMLEIPTMNSCPAFPLLGSSRENNSGLGESKVTNDLRETR